MGMKVYIVKDGEDILGIYESFDDASIAAVNQRCGDYNAPVYVLEREVIPAK